MLQSSELSTAVVRRLKQASLSQVRTRPTNNYHNQLVLAFLFLSARVRIGIRLIGKRAQWQSYVWVWFPQYNRSGRLGEWETKTIANHTFLC